jgi:hypothetical protein
MKLDMACVRNWLRCNSVHQREKGKIYMNIQIRVDQGLPVKNSAIHLKEPATRVNLTLLQPGGLVQGLEGTKHRFRSVAEEGGMAVEYFAGTDKIKDVVEINSYTSNAKLALR